MGYWTIQYFPESGSPVEKHLGDQQNGDPFWNVVTAKAVFNSQHPSQVAVTVDQPYDAEPLWPYGTKVKIWRDRTKLGQGGSIYFIGMSGNHRRAGSGDREQIQYTLWCPLYLMQQMTFEQQLTKWAAEPKTTHVVLNLDMSGQFGHGIGVPITISQQLQTILEDAILQGGSFFAFTVGELPDAVIDDIVLTPPTDEKRDIPHDQAITAELRWIPDTVVWFDFTVDPPKINFTRRADMTAVTFDINDENITINSGDIVSREDLQATQVILRYEQLNRVNSQNQTRLFEDKFPTSKTSPVSVRGTINLMGFDATQQTSQLTCRPMTLVQSAAGTGDDGSLTDWPWWKEKHPWLKKVTDLKVHDVIISNADLYEHQDGEIHDWMTLNNVSGGTPVTQSHALVNALADFTDEIGQKFVDQQIQVRVKTTNAPTNTYSRLDVTQLAEPVPIGLAKWLYNIVSVLQFEGQITINNKELPTTRYLGKVVNILNGPEEWETMNALVTSVSEDIMTGSVSITVGPNKYLSPGQMLDLLRVTRSRQTTLYVSFVRNAVANSTEVTSGQNLPTENSTSSTPKPSKHIVHNKGLDGKTTSVTHDAINGGITMESTDVTKPVVQMNFQDLLAIEAMN